MRKLSLILLALTLGVIILNAREVSGTVSSNKGKSLAGVIVTDGVNFTRTAAEGSFSFNISDDAEFVYIVSPSNYQPPIDSGAPVFYADADNGQTEFKFVLTELPKSNDYNIVAIADPQTMTDKQFKMMKGKPMRDLVKTFKALKGHTVGIALGDITWNNMELLPKYTDQFKRTGAAFYPVIGNHDYAIEAKGDHIASQTYRDVFGPENYAFYLGEDVVIVVDNIVYDTKKKFKSAYTDEVLAWVENLLKYIPKTSKIYLAQHSPMYHWFSKKDKIIGNGEKMMDLFGDMDVTILSGHTHINRNTQIRPNVKELNVAAFCGSWWTVNCSNDGTPAGYKVIQKKDDKISSYYKPIGKSKDYQVEVFNRGESELFPDKVLVSVWDYDDSWTVQWYLDGELQGDMERVNALSPKYNEMINKYYEKIGKKIPSFRKPRYNDHFFVSETLHPKSRVRVVVRNAQGKEWTYNLK